MKPEYLDENHDFILSEPFNFTKHAYEVKLDKNYPEPNLPKVLKAPDKRRHIEEYTNWIAFDDSKYHSDHVNTS